MLPEIFQSLMKVDRIERHSCRGKIRMECSNSRTLTLKCSDPLICIIALQSRVTWGHVTGAWPSTSAGTCARPFAIMRSSTPQWVHLSVCSDLKTRVSIWLLVIGLRQTLIFMMKITEIWSGCWSDAPNCVIEYSVDTKTISPPPLSVPFFLLYLNAFRELLIRFQRCIHPMDLWLVCLLPPTQDDKAMNMFGMDHMLKDGWRGFYSQSYLYFENCSALFLPKVCDNNRRSFCSFSSCKIH